MRRPEATDQGRSLAGQSRIGVSSDGGAFLAQEAQATFLSQSTMKPIADIEPLISAVVVPTDFSAADTQLLRRAIMLAHLFQAEIILLHVIDISDPSWFGYSGTSGDFMSHLQAEAEHHIAELLASLGDPLVRIKSLLVEGLPYEEIIGVLDAASLLLIRRPIPKSVCRLFSKRTAQRVLEDAPCALMVTAA